MHQGDGGIVRLVAMAGLSVALELSLTGREVPAEEAHRLGVVNSVVAEQDLLATAESYAEMIVRNSQQAVRSAKETIMDIVGRRLDDALKVEAINSYSNLGNFEEVMTHLHKFYSKDENS